jgi:predicted permease
MRVLSSLRSFVSAVSAVFGRSRMEDELERELRAHIQERADNLERSGLPRPEVQRRARLEFGAYQRFREECREALGAHFVETLVQDIRYALRMLRKAPGFTTVAVLTLALGIGANSTIFSWINATLLNPIPGVSHASQYVELLPGLSYPDYVDLRDRNYSLSALVAFDLFPMDLTASGKPQHVWGVFSTANYFDALGVHPILGRGFLPVEGTKPGAAPVAVISYRLWRTRFGGERSVIGRVIQLNKHPYTVIGVATPDFEGTQAGLRADLWVPTSMVEQLHDVDLLPARGESWLIPIARLKPGISREQAQADLNVVMQQIVRQHPNSHGGDNSITLDPLWRAPFGVNDYIHTILFLLMAVSGVVLLLACANGANLLLVRSVGRRREMAIRLSIGATRWRLIRQLLAESLILAFCGGSIAMLFTIWTAGTLGDFVPASGLPISMNVHTDRTVLLATFVISLIATAMFGILPALRSSALEPVTVLKEESGSAGGGVHKARLSSVLVVAQVAMSLLLLVSAGLFIRSVRAAQNFNLGFNPHNVLLDSYDLRSAGYDLQAGIEFDRQLLAKLEVLPGVQSATLINRHRASWVALSGAGAGGSATHTIPLSDLSSYTVQPEGYVPKPHEGMQVQYADVAPGYLRTMQIPLIAGREFSWSDTDKSQLVAIVNQEFVRLYWPGQEAIGKRLQADGTWYMVVGVARDSDYNQLGEKPRSLLYLPLTQDYAASVTVEARTFGNPLLLARSVEQAVHSLDADLPLFDLTTLDSRIQLATTTQRMGSAFVGGFGLVALVLAAIGIYGVLAYTTRQRTHEIGVRMALGAERRNVFGLVLGQGARLAILGVAIGLAASFMLTRAVSSQLFGVSAADPLTYVGVALLLCAVVLVACYLPARSAMRVDPTVALRHE